ncbi:MULTISPECIES: hypothetical protein [Sphingomonas]|uniref:Uncharacterized protein n=1 Tax=Sphingomonas molluscorum TaxID=418184 RepID=A0ABU8Q4U3_9SPHN|nr:hypothetical protein [Sphingomonas sp. JUb134]MBM7406298.1 hypothetical protein [Sphingomonas sp. JUb134]
MNDTGPFDRDHPHVDPQRTEPKNAFDRSDGASGQEYTPERALAEYGDSPVAPVHQSGLPQGDAVAPEGQDLPPDNGSRAWINQKTGEVHGSGAGAGGGNPGEDYDSDRQGGSGYPLTGSEQDGKGQAPG